MLAWAFVRPALARPATRNHEPSVRGLRSAYRSARAPRRCQQAWGSEGASGTSPCLSLPRTIRSCSRSKSRRCQRGSRSVSAAVYPAPVTASAWSQRRGPIPLPLIAESPSGRSLRCPRPWWSRPMPTDGCSVVARMPRYAPAPSGIRSESRIPATGQNGSPRHVLALFDSSSRRRIECRSGLLIRGFGVQIPGGAPVLSRHYMCLLLLFSVQVGPGWVRCGTRF